VVELGMIMLALTVPQVHQVEAVMVGLLLLVQEALTAIMAEMEPYT
jgi:hypothetical protein